MYVKHLLSNIQRIKAVCRDAVDVVFEPPFLMLSLCFGSHTTKNQLTDVHAICWHRGLGVLLTSAWPRSAATRGLAYCGEFLAIGS